MTRRRLSLEEHEQLAPLVNTLFFGVHGFDDSHWPKSRSVPRYKKRAITAVRNLQRALQAGFNTQDTQEHWELYRRDRTDEAPPADLQPEQYARWLYKDLFCRQILPRIEGRIPMTVLKAAARQLDCLAEAVSPQSIRSRT
jgi:hypothetical protein